MKPGRNLGRGLAGQRARQIALCGIGLFILLASRNLPPGYFHVKKPEIAVRVEGVVHRSIQKHRPIFDNDRPQWTVPAASIRIIPATVVVSRSFTVESCFYRQAILLHPLNRPPPDRFIS